jgi:excisionase family DNA binding protein
MPATAAERPGPCSCSEDEWLSVQEVAAELNCQRATVRRWVSRGVWLRGRRVRLEADRAGQRWRVSRAALKAFFAACRGD